MRLTTKGRFAVTAMIDLAMRQHSGPVTLAAISQRQNISLSYLEQLFGKLRRHELVDSVRGPGGGYSLARLARNVTVADIIFAVDEPLDATSCGGKRDCTSGNDGKPGKCMTHELLGHVESQDGRLPGFGVAAGSGRSAARAPIAGSQQSSAGLRGAREPGGGANTAANAPTTAVAANATV